MNVFIYETQHNTEIDLLNLAAVLKKKDLYIYKSHSCEGKQANDLNTFRNKL